MSEPPVTPTRPGRAWWAPTTGRMSPRARLATLAVVGALLALTVVVWTSPVGSVRAAPDGPTAAEVRLQAQNEELSSRLADSRAQADALRGVVADEQEARRKSEEARLSAQARREAEERAEDQQQAEARQAAADRAVAQERRTVATSGTDRDAQSTNQQSSGTAGPQTGTPSGTGAPDTGQPSAGPAKPTAPARAALVAPAHRYYGMYTEQAPFNWATFDAAAQKVGRTQNLVGYFGGWDEDFRASAVTRAWERGMLPMLTWESRPIKEGNNVVDAPAYSLPRIIGGHFDAYLARYAKAIVATGLPIAIRLDHEMNGTWYPWSEQSDSGRPVNGNRVGDYVRMWRHVHDIFEANGANQYVIWVWSPNIINNLGDRFQRFDTLRALYPGDAYVDWVGVSGYQRPPIREGNDSTFSYTYGRTLDQLRRITDRKILLAEVGASETGGTKPDWVRSFFRGFDPGRNDDVIGFAWFDLAVTTYVGGELTTNDWRVDSRSNSLDAFRTGLADPARNFGGTVLPGAPSAPTDETAAAAPTTSPATPKPATPKPATSAAPAPAAPSPDPAPDDPAPDPDEPATTDASPPADTGTAETPEPAPDGAEPSPTPTPTP